jgi:hypothetical protein
LQESDVEAKKSAVHALGEALAKTVAETQQPAVHKQAMATVEEKEKHPAAGKGESMLEESTFLANNVIPAHIYAVLLCDSIVWQS